MSDAQLGTLVAAALMSVCLAVLGFYRGRRPRVTYAQTREVWHTAPQDVPLRDALYLVRRHLAGQPTSRRQAKLPERAWADAIRLCRRAELLDAKGRWYIEDYKSAFIKLMAARKGHVDRVRIPNYVDAFGDDW